MRAYVYLISEYHEYGSQNMRATLDRDKVAPLLVEWATAMGHISSAYESRLKDVLKLGDDELCENSPYNLSEGWGGAQLHVVEVT